MTISGITLAGSSTLEAVWRGLWTRRYAYPAFILMSIALGCGVRTYFVVSADFPLNDGGLFFAMARDLQHSHFSLPAFTSYNGERIPFSYPPLGIYSAAALASIPSVSLVAIFRFLPLAASCLTLPAFYLLARSVSQSRLVVATAVLAFALISRSFVWLLMGGGVTRSLGLLFAILALEQVLQLYRRRRWSHVISAAILSALTLVSHLETAWFLAVSVGVFFVARGFNRDCLLKTVSVAVLAAVLTSPWWGSVVSVHGLQPFLAAEKTGGSIFSGGDDRYNSLLGLVRFVSTSEPFFPLIGALGLLGFLVSIASRRFFLAVWWAAIVALDVRAFPTYASLPMALLAGIGLEEVLLPALTRATSTSVWQANKSPRVPFSATISVAVVLASLVCYATAGSLVRKPGLGGEAAFLVSLSTDERQAMDWVSRATPSSSRFLLVPDSGWETAKTLEWFPVLAHRSSLSTVQGSEWLGDGGFQKKLLLFKDAYGCGYETSTCLDASGPIATSGFTHVYFAKPISGECCSTLLASLEGDARYRLLYDGAGATVFQRLGDETDPGPVTARTADGP